MALNSGVARGGRQLTQGGSIAAPYHGMNENQPAYNADPTTCFYTYNMMPSDYGMRTRAGSALWASGAGTDPVLTLIPSTGDVAGGGNDKLFAVGPSGIYDVTSRGTTTPDQEIAFAVTGGDAGYGNFTSYTNDAAARFIMYADGENGLIEYDVANDTWALSTGITGPTEANVRFVTSHKARMWLIEEDSTDAWYLPVGSKQGTATEFFFGAQSRHGGELVGLYNLTSDGGAGVDDMLVAIHRSGDITVWQGEDPASADTWRTVGIWYVGAIPAGRRSVSEYGGDLHILCASGIISVMDLMRGISVASVSTTGFGNQVNSTIRRIITDGTNIDNPAWSLYYAPSEKSYVVMIPPDIYDNSIQLVYDPVIDGWGFWRDVHMACMTSIRGQQFFGTLNGEVYAIEGSLDLVDMNGENGLPIKYSIATVATDFQSPSTFKKVEYLRPMYRGLSDHNYELKAVYDFSPLEIIYTSDNPYSASDSIWDTSKWDEAIWSGSINAFEDVRGGEGMGRNVSVAMRGEVTVRTTLIMFDVMFQNGGMM